jgi:hypothetical protein
VPKPVLCRIALLAHIGGNVLAQNPDNDSAAFAARAANPAQPLAKAVAQIPDSLAHFPDKRLNFRTQCCHPIHWR